MLFQEEAAGGGGHFGENAGVMQTPPELAQAVHIGLQLSEGMPMTEAEGTTVGADVARIGEQSRAAAAGDMQQAAISVGANVCRKEIGGKVNDEVVEGGTSRKKRR